MYCCSCFVFIIAVVLCVIVVGWPCELLYLSCVYCYNCLVFIVVSCLVCIGVVVLCVTFVGWPCILS